MKSLFSLLLSAVVLNVFISFAWAQGPASHWLNPDVGEVPLSSSYRFTFYPDQAVKGRSTDIGIAEHDVSFLSPLIQDSRNEWSFSTHLRAKDIDTGAVLPDTGESFPGNLWNVGVGTTYRRVLENGWIGGGNVTIGSASDKPFASGDEVSASATAFLRIPQSGRNAWFVFLNFSNNREFLNFVPLPGGGYWYEPSDRFRAIIGIPMSLRARPLDDLTFTVSYLPLLTIRSEVAYRILRPLSLYTGFDWTSQSYLRADRRDTDDRLFYYEKRVKAGVRFDITGWSTLDFSAGYAFDRFFFEGQGYDERDRNRIDVDDGLVLAVTVSARLGRKSR